MAHLYTTSRSHFPSVCGPELAGLLPAVCTRVDAYGR
jgi:hypothetical protein